MFDEVAEFLTIKIDEVVAIAVRVVHSFGSSDMINYGVRNPEFFQGFLKLSERELAILVRVEESEMFFQSLFCPLNLHWFRLNLSRIEFDLENHVVENTGVERKGKRERVLVNVTNASFINRGYISNFMEVLLCICAIV